MGLSYPELARNEGMDPYSSPYMTLYSSFHFLFHSFIPQLMKGEIQPDVFRRCELI